MRRALAAIVIAACVFACPVRTLADTGSSPLPDPEEIILQITSPSEKQKLMEALEELEYRGLTPRAVLESLTGENGPVPGAGTPGELADQLGEHLEEQFGEQASGLMEDATQEISQDLRRNFLQSLLDTIGEKLDEVFGR